MEDMTASGRESLRVGASAFRAAVTAFEEARPGAEPSIRRLAGALEKLARSYRAAAIETAARRLAEAPTSELGAAIPALLEALADLPPLREEATP